MITYVDTSSVLELVIEEDGSDTASVIWDSAAELAEAEVLASADIAFCDAAGRQVLHVANSVVQEP